MNRRSTYHGLQRASLLARLSNKEGTRIVKHARTLLPATPNTDLIRDRSHRTRTIGNPVMVGFSRHGRTKRMMGWETRKPCLHGENRAWRSFSPPSPGYPSLGCTPAEPNSVSPGNMHHSSRSRCLHRRDKTGTEVAQNATAKNVRRAP